MSGSRRGRLAHGPQSPHGKVPRPGARRRRGVPGHGVHRRPSLAVLRSETPPKPDAAATLIEQVAEGLEAVHACGLLHRDLKPSNIVVGDDGVPRLVDFGVASHLGSPALQGLSGTPAYMAPEQARRSGCGSTSGPTSTAWGRPSTPS